MTRLIRITFIAAAILLAFTPASFAADAAPLGEPGQRIAMGEIFFMQRHPATHKMEWFGSMIIWALIGLSAVSVALMGVHFWDNRRERIMSDALAGRAAALLKDGRITELADFIRTDDSDFARTLEAGLARRGGTEEEIVVAAEEMKDALAARRLRRIEPLNIIGNIGPMIGLFATVYGMILVFRAIVAAGGTPDPTSLAAGIGTKLVGTFWGLIVAIPALAAYAFLRNRIETLSAEAMDAAKELLANPRLTGADAGTRP